MVASVGSAKRVSLSPGEELRFSLSRGALATYGDAVSKNDLITSDCDVSARVAGDQSGRSDCFEINSLLTPVTKSGDAPVYNGRRLGMNHQGIK